MKFTNRQVAELVARRMEYTAQAKELAETIATIDSRLMAWLDESGQEGWAQNGLQITRVKSHTRTLDDAKLRRTLTPKQIKSIEVVEVRLDILKLEAEIRAGNIVAKKVAGCIQENPRKPYLRYSRG